MTNKAAAVSLVALAVACGWSAAAAAQTAAPPAAGAAAAPEDNGLAQIVVTSQRREQQLQRVPLAITALGSADLERRQIRNTIDLITQVPNLIGNNNVGLGSSNTYYIRGVGNTESIATQDVPVGTYVDDVYISRQNANNFGLFDVERIEVLRGPQGTLFGRNTTGGAINVIMRKPSTHFGGYVEGAYGRYNLRELRGSIDVPLNDKLLTKFSAYRQRDDGYVLQPSTGKKLNDLDTYGLRGAIRFLPTDALTVDLTADYTDEGISNLVFNVDPATGQRVTRLGIVPGGVASYFVGSKAGLAPGNRARTAATSLNLSWNAGPVTVTSITGFRDTHQLYFIDSINAAPNPLPYGVSSIANSSWHAQWSQEFRASGRALSDRLDYVAGVYWLRENNKTDLGTGTGTAAAFTVTGDRVIKNTLDTYAAYAQGDYKLTDKLTATAGLRYTTEDKKLDVQKNAGARGAALSSALIAASGIPLELKNNFWTPRFALAYQATKDIMFFASATRGEKSGGWNGRAIANNLFLPFNPEKVWSEEVGMRADLFDHRLRLNVTGFYAYTKDVQISAAYFDASGNRIFTTTNPADLRNYGAEIESTWIPINRLTIQTSAGLQHARYTNVSAPVQQQINNCTGALAARNTAVIASDCNRGFVDFKGRIALPVRAPDLTVIHSWSYELDSGFAVFRPTAGVTYSSGFTIGNAGNSDSTDNQYVHDTLYVNASLAIEPTALRNVSFTVDCKNCFDRTYRASYLSPTAIYYTTPGVWSVRARYRF